MGALCACTDASRGDRKASTRSATHTSAPLPSTSGTNALTHPCSVCPVCCALRRLQFSNIRHVGAVTAQCRS